MRHLLLLLVLSLAASVDADVEQVVRCHEIGFARSVEDRDRGRFASYIDPDARFVGSSVRRGVAEISEAWSRFLMKMAPASSGARNSLRFWRMASWPFLVDRFA